MAAVLIFFNQLALYLLLAFVLSFVVRPLVDGLDKYVSLPRTLITAFIYLCILGALLAYPISAAPGIVRNVGSFIGNLPSLLEQAAMGIVSFVQKPIVFRGETYTLPYDETVNEAVSTGLSLAQSSLGSVSGLLTGVASVTVEVVSWVAFVLFVSFHLTRLPANQVSDAVMEMVPDEYEEDAGVIFGQLDRVWGSFLRGQIILMLTIGVVVFCMARALGLPNALALAVIAGLLEVIPYLGPVLSAVPGGLIAFFSYDQSWIGDPMGPFFFMLLVLFCYWLVQQLENYILLPRIMGTQLNLHPVVVFTAAIAGFQLGGIVAVFFASPMVATLRLLIRYLWCKITGRQVSAELPDLITIESGELQAEEPKPEVEPTKPAVSDNPSTATTD